MASTVSSPPAKDAPERAVFGELNYRAVDDTGLDMGAPLQAVTKRIENGRTRSWDLDENYFNLVKHETQVHSLPEGFYSDQATMQNVYYPELEELLKRETGAAHVIVVGHLAREAVTPAHLLGDQEAEKPLNKSDFASNIEYYKKIEEMSGRSMGGTTALVEDGATKFGVDGKPEKNLHNGAASVIHSDYDYNHKERIISYFTKGSKHHTEGGIQAFVDPRGNDYYDLVKKTGLTPEQLRNCRIQVINIWRAAEEFPLRRMPLALADQKTVRHTDVVTTRNSHNTEGAHGRRITLSDDASFPMASAVGKDRHKFYFFPEMEADEAVLLKTYDSLDYDTGADYRLCWHSAFHDPTTPEDCGPRHSCEARAVLITPYPEKARL